MKLRSRHRRLIALLALFGLLFQQIAMAAYVCPQGLGDPATAATDQPPCHQASSGDRARCHQHCHPLQASSTDAPAASVPAALLPPTTWVRQAARVAVPDGPARRELIARASAPPISVRDCTFQI